MNKINSVDPVKFSVVIPCYNEEETLSRCVQRLLDISDGHLSLEIIIVDDRSTDKSFSIACELEKSHPQVTVLRHQKKHGKRRCVAKWICYSKGRFCGCARCRPGI